MLETLSAIFILERLLGFLWADWARPFFRDGPCNMPASVNIFTEADNLKCPPRLIAINRGRHFKLSASVNIFSVAGKSDHHGK